MSCIVRMGFTIKEPVELLVGTVYTLSGTNTTANQPIKAVCIQMNETNKTAVMQSYGFGHGYWPGQGTFAASTYGTTVGKFNMSDVQLAKGGSATNLTACGVSGQSSLIRTALVDAANHHSSFGATHNADSGDGAWLGTPYTANTAWYVTVDGGFGTPNLPHDHVVAPCFILDLTNVKMNGTTLTAS